MSWNDYMEVNLIQAHREELQRQAEQFRAHSVRVVKDDSGVYGAVLARVGKTLSALGDSLQERYETTEDQPVYSGERRPKTA